MSTTMPEELAGRVAAARQVLNDRPDGHLPRPWRIHVREGFGPQAQDAQGRRSPGWLRRVWLARACAERVLGYWQAERPEDPRPQRMIELANQVATGQLDVEQTSIEWGDFRNDVDEMQSAGQISERALFASYAALMVVPAASAIDYDPQISKLNQEDEFDNNLYPDEWEAEYCAAQAAASQPGVPGGDPGRRRAFWEWYLSEAVPAAYAAVPGQ